MTSFSSVLRRAERAAVMTVAGAVNKMNRDECLKRGVLAEPSVGDGPLSARVRPSSPTVTVPAGQPARVGGAVPNACATKVSARIRPSAGSGPYISTWNWPTARQSVSALARLEPDVLACGHGRPVARSQAAAGLAALAGRFSPQPASGRSRNGGAASTGWAGSSVS